MGFEGKFSVSFGPTDQDLNFGFGLGPSWTIKKLFPSKSNQRSSIGTDLDNLKWWTFQMNAADMKCCNFQISRHIFPTLCSYTPCTHRVLQEPAALPQQHKTSPRLWRLSTHRQTDTVNNVKQSLKFDKSFFSVFKGYKIIINKICSENLVVKLYQAK